MKTPGWSIRTRLAVSVFVAVGLFLLVDHGLRRASFRGTFDELERSRAEEVLKGVDRAILALSGELSHYAETIVRSGGPKPIDCREFGLEGAFVVHPDGHVFRSAWSTEAGAKGAKGLSRSFPSQWSEFHPFLRTWKPEKGPGEIPSGIFPVTGSSDLVLFGSSEVIIEGKEALSVAVRAVDDQLLEEIGEIAGIRPEFFLLSNPATNPVDLKRVDEATATRKPVIASRSAKAVTVYSPFDDFTGMPVGGIKAEIPLTNAELWARMERFELLTALGVVVVFPLLLLVLVQLVVTGPLGRLTSHVVEIGESDNGSLRLDSERSDEIGLLANEFDQMLGELERSRVLQRRSARLTGRSEIAADVVHSTGNILNSIAVSSNLAAQKATDLNVDDLRALQRELDNHSSDLAAFLTDDPRGKHALPFLGACIDHLEAGISGLEEDAKSVEGLVAKAADMLLSLRNEDQSSTVEEEADLEQLLEEAVASVGAEQSEVSVELQMEAQPTLRLDRQRLLEVFTAVVQNAVSAMVELPPVERALVISVKGAATGYQIEFTDTGKGIEPELLPRVFEMGSSGENESAGLGLHKASLSMQALAGDIKVASEGPGLGAKVTLTVPDGARAAGAAQGSAVALGFEGAHAA